MADLKGRGYDLAGKDGCTRLVVVNSGTPLPDADRELVRQHKDALLALLWAREGPDCEPCLREMALPGWATRPKLTVEELAELRELVCRMTGRLNWPGVEQPLWDAVKREWHNRERTLLEELRKWTP